VRHYLDRNPFM